MKKNLKKKKRSLHSAYCENSFAHAQCRANVADVGGLGCGNSGPALSAGKRGEQSLPSLIYHIIFPDAGADPIIVRHNARRRIVIPPHFIAFDVKTI